MSESEEDAVKELSSVKDATRASFRSAAIGLLRDRDAVTVLSEALARISELKEEKEVK